MTTTELGQFGENIAARFLIENGFHILERNFRFKKGEIDIIAEVNDFLVVIEVKTRQTAEIGEPWRAVTRAKQRQIIQVANNYIQSSQIIKNARFDIVSIVTNSYRTSIEHITDAFYA